MMPKRTSLDQATEAAKALGVPEDAALWGTEVARRAGSQPTRHYHTTSHFAYMMNGAHELATLLSQHGTRAETNRMLQYAYRLVGRDHDVVYLSADKQMLMPAILDKPQDGRPTFRFAERPEDYVRMIPLLIQRNYAAGTDENAARIATCSGLGIGKYLKPELNNVPEAGLWLRSYTIAGEHEAAKLLPEQQQNLRIALAAFDKEYGSPLYPLDGGQNEFLSCLHTLEVSPHISLKAKVAIAAMHQATIAFQSPDSIERLIKRMATITIDGKLVLTPQETHAIGLAAAHFANRDVAGFKGPKAHYQQGSLELMHESCADFDAPLSSSERIARRLAFLEGSLLKGLNQGNRAIFRNYTYHDASGSAKALYTDDAIKSYTQAARHQIADEVTWLKAMQKIAKHYEASGTAVDLATVARTAARINPAADRARGNPD